MSNLPSALAKFIHAVSNHQAGAPLPEDSIRDTLNALDSLNNCESAQAALTSAINNAERAGDLHVDGVPIAVLRCLIAAAATTEVRNG
ncbi:MULTISPECIES: hypothetical protein [unclassified Pseudomonas]|uniref:hypothetical protein n=1 Tax=unclassified Pseudomonas TaxID=196821 RepID=UPI000C87C32E|nr:MULTISPECIES: hypothetical protein [unclassified Pseudomonas]PMU11724.1 hypothetical protein C1Y11_04100 [Pseudomonas sp. FW305-20]PMU15388.1 hypothetical protein C1Y10_22470 [Pseudomonas sp. FW305-122]PMU43231.1 hypothetical protein C1Y12_03425 [Pseudomonas sp. FW305-47B]PMX63522.1 hypothetical protein C1X12_22610 [Pseudomonas sp. FW305-60]PMX64556.1 hypothetical protein C1Y13_04220 [Pseudomonas sp. FW305-33]